MEVSPDERALLWLCAVASLSERECAAAVRLAGTPARVYERAEEILPEIAEKPFSRALGARERETDALLHKLSSRGQFFVTPLSEEYPAALRHISLPPLVLFGAGRRELLGREMFCIVGSRNIPPWAAALGKKISEAVSREFAVVTGLAEGGDAAAAEGALASGNLLSVLPCGLNECYPASHAALKEKIAKRGLLLSELPPDDKAKKYSFHARNRILAGLAVGTLVLSAGEKSGTLITANCALDFGRDVFALPHNAGTAQGAGCNDLLKKGAYVVTEAADILSVYGKESAAESPPGLSPEEARVYGALRESGEAHVALLAEQTGMRPHELLPVLSSLEIKGLAVRAGGNRYQAIK